MRTRHLTCHGSAISVWQLIPKRSSCQAGFGCLSPPSVSKLTSSTHSLSLTELHSSLPQLYLSQQPTDHPLHPPTPYWCMSNDSAAHCEATLRQGRYIHVTCKPNGLPVAATSGAQDAGSSERRVAQQGNPYLPKRTGCHIRQPAPSETCYQPGLYVFHKSQPTWRFRCGMATQTRLPYRI